MKNFTIIDNQLLSPSQLSAQEKLLLIILIKLAGKDDHCYPGQKYLAKVMGYKHPRQIRTILKNLKKEGLVVWKRTGFNQPNTYYPAKQFISDGKSTSPHLSSKFPLHSGSVIPTKNTYRKAKDKKEFEKGMEVARKKLKELNIIY